jgi:hypothetical protein
MLPCLLLRLSSDQVRELFLFASHEKIKLKAVIIEKVCKYFLTGFLLASLKQNLSLLVNLHPLLICWAFCRPLFYQIGQCRERLHLTSSLH